jgi:HEAT repeat protein
VSPTKFRLRTFGGLILEAGNQSGPLLAAHRKPLAFLALLATGSPELRQRSAEVLSGVPDLDAARLVAALGDGERINQPVAGLLARRGERAIPELVSALASGRDDLWDGAVLALSRMDPAAWPALVPHLHDRRPRVRLGVATALEGSGWAPADVGEAFALRSALGDWDAVADLGPAAVPLLIGALADPHPSVREGAARTLGIMLHETTIALTTLIPAAASQEE